MVPSLLLSVYLMRGFLESEGRTRRSLGLARGSRMARTWASSCFAVSGELAWMRYCENPWHLQAGSAARHASSRIVSRCLSVMAYSLGTRRVDFKGWIL